MRGGGWTVNVVSFDCGIPHRCLSPIYVAPTCFSALSEFSASNARLKASPIQSTAFPHSGTLRWWYTRWQQGGGDGGGGTWRRRMEAWWKGAVGTTTVVGREGRAGAVESGISVVDN